MSGHTPLPWTRHPRGMAKFIVRGADGHFVADVRGASRTDAENEANADFIIGAAAERDRLREVNAELLAALKQITFAYLDDEDEWIRKLAVDAIKKAEERAWLAFERQFPAAIASGLIVRGRVTGARED